MHSRSPLYHVAPMEQDSLAHQNRRWGALSLLRLSTGGDRRKRPSKSQGDG